MEKYSILVEKINQKETFEKIKFELQKIIIEKR